MGHFRALKALQSSKFGLKQPGQDFHWTDEDGSIIGWHVEALDDDARRMLEERAKVLAERGVKQPVEDRPLPTQPFPQGVMKASAGMSAPQVVAGTMGIDRTPAPDADAPQMAAPPRRRRQA